MVLLKFIFKQNRARPWSIVEGKSKTRWRRRNLPESCDDQIWSKCLQLQCTLHQLEELTGGKDSGKLSLTFKFGCIKIGRCTWFWSKYSNHPKTGDPNTGFIWIPNLKLSRFQSILVMWWDGSFEYQSTHQMTIWNFDHLATGPVLTIWIPD